MQRVRRFELSDRIKVLLKGFKRSESQGFGNYEEADRLLSEFCGYCQKKKKCKINYGLRCAMGEDYPFWANVFVKLENNSAYDAPENVPSIRVRCREYQEAQRKV